MHDAHVRPFMPMFSGEIPAGPLEQGVALSRWRGLGEHSGGLVDNQDLRILIKDVQPSGRCAGAGPIGMVDKLCLRLNLQRRLETRLTVDVHLALPHGFLRGAARQAEQFAIRLSSRINVLLSGSDEAGQRVDFLEKPEDTYTVAIRLKPAGRAVVLAAPSVCGDARSWDTSGSCGVRRPVRPRSLRLPLCTRRNR